MTTPRNTGEKVAFEVDVNYMRCIVFAATAAKARWIAVKGYWDAGYGRKGLWPMPKAARVPRFDSHPKKNDGPRCWAESSLL